MDKDLKIVVIGAGSASFGLETLTGLLSHQEFKGRTELTLVDTNPTNLKEVHSLAEKINHKWDSQVKIEAESDRKKALENSDFVVLSVAVDRENTWIKDHELALKYGIWHYAENGGPGSFSHTARGLSFIMPILYDIHDLAPGAWLLNYTNPVPRIGYAAEHAGVKSVGLCHQIWHAYAITGRYLAKDMGVTEPHLLNYEWAWSDSAIENMVTLSDRAYERYKIIAAGLNHFIWVMDVRRRGSSEDLYPLVRAERENVNANFEPLTQHMFKVFGWLPGPGDTHLAEYIPYTATEANWRKYNIQLYDFEWARARRDEMWAQIRGINSGTQPLILEPNTHERADWIIKEIFFDESAYEHSVNIVNNGSITNLPDDAIVEVPALVGATGLSGQKVGRMPEAIASLLNREVTVAKLITKASIEGDRTAAVQAFALDPMVNDLRKAELMVEDYIAVHKKYLPQFD